MTAANPSPLYPDHSIVFLPASAATIAAMKEHTVAGVTVLPMACINAECGCTGKHRALTIAACKECNIAAQGATDPSKWHGAIVLAHTGGWVDTPPAPEDEYFPYSA